MAKTPQTESSSETEFEANTTMSTEEVVNVKIAVHQEALINFMMEPETHDEVQDEDIPDTTYQDATPGNKIVGGLTFTLDDIPYHKWHGRLQEFYACMNAKATDPNDDQFHTHLKFTARFTGSLLDWWLSFAPASQNTSLAQDFDHVIHLLHFYSIGKPEDLFVLNENVVSYQRKTSTNTSKK